MWLHFCTGAGKVGAGMGVMLNRSGLKNLGPEKLGPEKLGPERLGPERLGPV